MEKNQQALPQARTIDLVTQEMPDEVLIYDLKSHKAHCLNRTVAQIWHLCDGKTSVPEIARRLEKESSNPVDEELVWMALGQLNKSRLLEQNVIMPDAAVRLSRRAAVRKLGLGTAMALPVIVSIIAPTSVGAASFLADGQQCTASAQCLNGCCDCQPTPNVCAPLSGTSGGTRQGGAPCSNPHHCCSNSCTGTPGTCAPH